MVSKSPGPRPPQKDMKLHHWMVWQLRRNFKEISRIVGRNLGGNNFMYTLKGDIYIYIYVDGFWSNEWIKRWKFCSLPSAGGGIYNGFETLT